MDIIWFMVSFQISNLTRNHNPVSVDNSCIKYMLMSGGQADTSEGTTYETISMKLRLSPATTALDEIFGLRFKSVCRNTYHRRNSFHFLFILFCPGRSTTEVRQPGPVYGLQVVVVLADHLHHFVEVFPEAVPVV